MIKVLFIARYRDSTMTRKVELLAEQPDISIRHVCPRYWEDEFVRVAQVDSAGESAANALKRVTYPMIGRPNNPHWALYETLGFGVKEFQPDIIHAEEEPDSLAALQVALARRAFAPEAKLVLHTWQNINRPKRWHVRTVLLITLNASDAILCANGEAVEVLEQQGFRRTVRVLPAVGVDTRVFNPGSPGSAFPDSVYNSAFNDGSTFDPDSDGRDSAEFVIGYVGRLVAEKGLDTLLSAVSRLNHSPGGIRLIVVGDGPCLSALKEQAYETGLSESIDFVPPMSPRAVAQQMRKFDALVLPSRATRVWKEQLGRVLIEAMACKVPVVGSDSGAIPEVVGDAGLIFPENDVEALAGCLRRIISSRELRRELGERGHSRAIAIYSQEQIARRTAETYRELMAGGRS